MTNREKYKDPEERAKKFLDYCYTRKSCEDYADIEGFMFECSECCAVTSFLVNSKEEAIERWNRRTDK